MPARCFLTASSKCGMRSAECRLDRQGQHLPSSNNFCACRGRVCAQERSYQLAFATNGHAGKLESEVVVSLVRADPEPEILAVPFSRDGAVAATNFDGVNTAFLLEAQ